MIKDINILHLAADEKFINGAHYIFNKAFTGQNKFLIAIQGDKNDIKHVDTTNKGIEVVAANQEGILNVLEELPNYDFIVFHSLNEFNVKVINQTKEKKNKFIWMLFGFEIYFYNPKAQHNIYGRLTKKIYYNNLYKLKRKVFKIIQSKQQVNNSHFKKALQEINYCGILYNEEFNFLINRNVITSNVKMLRFTYYPIEYIYKNNENLTVTGTNILVGNSATPTNNHFEAFELIKVQNLGSNKIITPLSYGIDKYRDKVVHFGNDAFGDAFMPLTSFMPMAEYLKLLSSCGIVIMNHYRQQAVGTVLSMLWMGAKVFLNEKNTLYHYLKRIGCHIFSITEDFEKGHKPLKLLTKEEVEKNRSILKLEISTDVVIKNLKEDFQRFYLD